MIDAKTRALVADRLAVLDFTAEDERIAAIETSSAEIEKASRIAEARISEINRIELEDKHVRNGAEVADALLSGGVEAAAVAGVTLDQLREERDGLRSALAELNRRSDENYREIRSIQDRTMQRIGAALAPLIEAAQEQARKNGAALVESWKTVATVDAIVRGALPGRPAENLSRVATRLLDSEGLCRGHDLEINAELASLLSPIEVFGRAARRYIPSSLIPPV